MTLQYTAHNLSQMIEDVVRVFPVIPDDNETTEGGASNVTKGSHISRGQWAHHVTPATLHSSSQVIC